MDGKPRPSWSEIAEFASAAAALSLASLVIAFLPFRIIVRLMGEQGGRSKAPGGDIAIAIRVAVQRASRRLPWCTVCFQQGLAAHWLLRARGHPSRLHYGLKHDDGRLTAHVWVTLNEETVIGEESGRQHACLAVFPASETRA